MWKWKYKEDILFFWGIKRKIQQFQLLHLYLTYNRIKGLVQSQRIHKMPIYEYKCMECGKKTEFFQKNLKQKSLITCPFCGSTKMEKLLSSPGAIRMGSATPKGSTCCGRTERCDTPPCSSDGTCRRD
jgi:putative FmdB family regulatory protein